MPARLRACEMQKSKCVAIRKRDGIVTRIIASTKKSIKEVIVIIDGTENCQFANCDKKREHVARHPKGSYYCRVHFDEVVRHM